jgi:hypothetical protein
MSDIADIEVDVDAHLWEGDIKEAKRRGIG